MLIRYNLKTRIWWLYSCKVLLNNTFLWVWYFLLKRLPRCLTSYIGLWGNILDQILVTTTRTQNIWGGPLEKEHYELIWRFIKGEIPGMNFAGTPGYDIIIYELKIWKHRWESNKLFSQWTPRRYLANIDYCGNYFETMLIT